MLRPRPHLFVFYLALLFAPLQACNCQDTQVNNDPNAETNNGCPSDDPACAGPCEAADCRDDQTCEVTQDGEAACVCPEGTTDTGDACACPAGTHLEGDFCAQDDTCTETTCAGHGVCSDDDGEVSCVCDEGFAPPFCEECDEASGYHADGEGGCTTDPCLPNPCTAENQSVCQPQGVGYECACDPGYHPEDDACVVDETCDADSCSGHGTCDDSSGSVACDCEDGYVGDHCDECDVNAGYHDDGMGGCTTDPCLPNPCTDPNKTVCTSGMTGHVCSCDPGFHPDGAGGCTDDPCVPNACAQNNQACRVVDGMAECYTPDCDDQNPCTDDELVNGVCEHTPLADGTPCSTTECTDGQTCTAGTCDGGDARDCDDDNGCTVDSCDDVFGCQHEVDDTLTPDDGVACTTDSCTNGIADHVPDDGACDDGLYCTGDGFCRPSDPAADGDGCVAENVPTPPPAPDPCQYYGACDEATQSFPLYSRSTGDPCDDGIYCTNGETCDSSGTCVGTLVADCSSGTCSSTSPFPATIDIPQARLDVDVTIDGQPIPATSSDSSPFHLYAVAEDTGVRHYLTRFEYHYTSGDLEGPWPTERLIPGVYDIVLDRYPGSRTKDDNLAPYGERVLVEDVVLTAGDNTLNIDIPQTELTVDVTIGGQPIPATSTDSSPFNIYAIAHDTGVRHYLTRFEYHYTSGDLEGPWPTDRLIPGTYDIVLDRYPGSRTKPDNLAPYGERLLMKDVIISGASQTLDIDIPQTELNIDVTIDGQQPPANSSDSSPFHLYAVAKDTGVRHYLTRFEYHYTSGDLEGPWPTDRLIPGTYDILLDRYPGSRTQADNLAPYGERVLMEDVVISGASQDLNIDIPQTELTIDVTIDGQQPPANSGDSSPFHLYAVAKDTGVRHYLTRFEYHYTSGDLEGPWPTDRLIPGTYDILLDRYPGSRTQADNLAPYGERILMRDVVVSGSSQSLDIDIPQTELTIDVTIDGQQPPANSGDSSPFHLYAVAKDTGVRHYLTRFEYHYTSGDLEGPWPTDRLIPGTYDLLLDRYPGSRTKPDNLAPYGERILAQDVQISGATQAVTIDIPSAAMNFDVTVGGQSLPANSPDSSPFHLYAVARDTKVRHYLTRFEYHYTSGDLEGPWPTDRLVDGTYDVVLDRYPGSQTKADNLAPYGERYLGICYDVQ